MKALPYVVMEPASETLAAFTAKDEAIRDRELFVHNLGELLGQTREGVDACVMHNTEAADEFVRVHFKDGFTKDIHTAADSYIAIVRDVTKSI